ncbi:Clan U, family U48, CaaX prenyl peptidase 2-like [Trichomonas vaginalis G3]|uniref:intramembrane prenyl-peptidase Rce1 n=1 Tax=Trichomonas vaginalis (strain ATCC PRA-98 / G3) TaxID=412133 RepID=A2ER89_TRIV3|nr:Clan U, family U48, CaaX prenyl peptidase 2-like [Trichomonas vaginalis G3]EAY04842.1 Clan U, family U48, CaaX prenyl peptidase 2-like [Trichomonas vaginalis G3]KAI5535364.1 Clan U, family U48, CaaX prenyl peptidase 2-like [Trichomonas vaginalis G3]|eukprot:XP_001317065.1 Clan U, family U48, CaaX prenyl peptidase 2-like [Trichomonas vaginalis G3]
MISELKAVGISLCISVTFISIFYVQKLIAPSVKKSTYRLTVIFLAFLVNFAILMHYDAVHPVYAFGDSVCSLLFILTTVCLFIGPIFQNYFKFMSRYNIVKDKNGFLKNNLRSFIYDFPIIDVIIAPALEELLYRYAGGNLWLKANISDLKVIFLSPLIFGVAHFHHFFELHGPWQKRLIKCIIQVGFTSLFGFWTTFCWIKTHGLLTCMILHGFCNYMQFPDFAEALNWPNLSQRKVLYTSYISGIIIYVLLTYIIAKY